jgi:hypothetical protein
MLRATRTSLLTARTRCWPPQAQTSTQLLERSEPAPISDPTMPCGGLTGGDHDRIQNCPLPDGGIQIRHIDLSGAMLEVKR